MNSKQLFTLLLVGFLLATQLPSLICILSHTPEGDLEDTPDTTETVNEIEALVRCITPESAGAAIVSVLSAGAAQKLNG